MLIFALVARQERGETLMVLEFGSRSGSWFALVLFSLIVGVLAWGIAREVRIRSAGQLTTVGRALGLAMFLGLLSLVYGSMVSGFYEAEVNETSIRLRYLWPGLETELSRSGISARMAPAYRDRVRLVLSDTTGDHASTPWPRARVAASLATLNTVLTGRR